MYLKHKSTTTITIMQLLLFCKIMVDMQKILFAAFVDCLQIGKWFSGYGGPMAMINVTKLQRLVMV